jgi:serine/threonine-protein kinase
MPPEQVSRKHGAIGPAADVYGLGATLYHLLTGRPPFTGDSPAQITVHVERDQPERPRALRPEIPLNLEAIVVKCLEKKAADRYPSPGALADDLDKCLAGQPQEALPLTRTRRLRRWVGRNRARIAGGVAVMLALVAAFLAGYWYKFFPPDPAEHIRRELRAGRSVTLVGETGLPRYHRWRLGGGEFGTSTTGEGACYYESVGYSLLELAPDPGIDRYRLTLDICHVGAAGGPPVSPDRSWVGPYFGHAESPTADGRSVHTLFGSTFSDIHPNAAKPVVPNKGLVGQPQHVVRVRPAGLSVKANRDPGLQQRTVGSPLEFTPSPGLVGQWRTFRIDVTPEGVRVEWKDPTGAFVPVAVLDAAATARAYTQIQNQVNAGEPASGLVIPEWSPRMPLGIWSFRAAVSIRNVVISPL